MTANGPGDEVLELEQSLGRFSPEIDVAVCGELSVSLRTVPDDESRIDGALAKVPLGIKRFVPADFHFSVDVCELEVHRSSPEVQEMIADVFFGEGGILFRQRPPVEEIHQPLAVVEGDVSACGAQCRVNRSPALAPFGQEGNVDIVIH